MLVPLNYSSLKEINSSEPAMEKSRVCFRHAGIFFDPSFGLFSLYISPGNGKKNWLWDCSHCKLSLSSATQRHTAVCKHGCSVTLHLDPPPWFLRLKLNPGRLHLSAHIPVSQTLPPRNWRSSHQSLLSRLQELSFPGVSWDSQFLKTPTSSDTPPYETSISLACLSFHLHHGLGFNNLLPPLKLGFVFLLLQVIFCHHVQTRCLLWARCLFWVGKGTGSAESCVLLYLIVYVWKCRAWVLWTEKLKRSGNWKPFPLKTSLSAMYLTSLL